MAELGALSSYALAVNQVQLNAVKNAVQMQQQLIDVVRESTERLVAASSSQGQHIDISI
ncbi:MAG: hypothetical protein J6A33_01565 [Alphaproteobacteria bacterium]|nr:hypothetical protein [Alphaproteobacteria bacterium]